MLEIMLLLPHGVKDCKCSCKLSEWAEFINFISLKEELTHVFLVGTALFSYLREELERIILY